MTYQTSLRSTLLHLQKTRSQFDPEKLGIPNGSSQEAAIISSLDLVEELLKLRMGAEELRKLRTGA